MTEERFTNRELIKMFHDQSEDLKNYMDLKITPLTEQVKYTNGKLKRMSVILIIVASVTLTLLFTNGSELGMFILKII